MTDTSEQKLWKTIKDLRTAMLTTEGERGLESRPMATYLDEDSRTIRFITRIDSSKTDEIRDDAHVNLAYSDTNADTYVSVTGTARVTRDVAKQKELWNPFAEAWMPEGPEAPTTALIEVTPSHASIWDAPSKLVKLFEVARANLTQTPATSGDVVHVEL